MPITKNHRKQAAELLAQEVYVATRDITDSGRKRWFSQETVYRWARREAREFTPEELALLVIANKTNFGGWEVDIASDLISLVEVILSEHISRRLESEGWEREAGPRTNDRWYNTNVSKGEGA